MFKKELSEASRLITAVLAEQGVDTDVQISWQPTPFREQWGFGSAVCFKIAANEARSGKKVKVPLRAQELAESILAQIETPPGFVRTQAIHGYINLYLDPGHYAARTIDTILDRKETFGRAEPVGKRVMVEYSQPNTHKAFHVGHLRNVILGGALSNILDFAGYETIRANYIGDIGWHVIQWMWCYLKYHNGEEPGADPTRWMADIYSEAVRKVEEAPQNEQEARKMFARWDAQETEIVALWKKTRAWSLEGFEQIYDVLGEHFDIYFFESEVEDSGKVLVGELIKRGLAIDERPEGGPVIIKLDEVLGLEKEKYRVLVLLRSDGTSLYATKDLSLAIRKFKEFNIDRSIYVIDVRQSLYLEQVFKVLEIMGFEQAQECFHLSYEIVNLPGNVTISSREGAVVLFNDLVDEAIDRAVAIVNEKNPSLPDDIKQDVARKVALGAIKYPMVAVDNNKIATFDWEQALDFEGQAAPYIQYAHVRANSILTRAEHIPEAVLPEYELEEAEIILLNRLSRFPEEIQHAAREYKPLHIANYAYELAKEFTSFYQKCPVLKAEGNRRIMRIRLTAAARQTIANSLALLGVEAPRVM